MRPMIATRGAAVPRAGIVLALSLLLLQPLAIRPAAAQSGGSAAPPLQAVPYSSAPAPGAAPGAPNGPPPTPQEEGADQLVGLFAATCLRYPGDVQAMRGFLTTQGAPVMPPQARQAFLGGRAGQVFDTSYQGSRLALISLDDGSCEAVAEFAGPQQVLDYVQEAMRDAQLIAQPEGDFTDPKRPDVHQRVWQVTLSGRPWLVTAVTAAQAPQASLGLHPAPPPRQQ